MNPAVAGASVPGAATLEAIDEVAGWVIHHLHETASTNLFAARLPAWHAVRADVQTAGRGRFQRGWVSDEGGLWLSAVMPLLSSTAPALLPLLCGAAVCDALTPLGVQGLRMRWPNDIMVEHCKLAGLLIDQFAPGLAVIGIGLNVTNCPADKDASLSGRVTRLADLVTPTPSTTDLARAILHELTNTCATLSGPQADAALARINSLWNTSLPVEVDLDGVLRRGAFLGVDAAGRLRLRAPSGEIDFYEPRQVRQLRESVALDPTQSASSGQNESVDQAHSRGSS